MFKATNRPVLKPAFGGFMSGFYVRYCAFCSFGTKSGAKRQFARFVGKPLEKRRRRIIEAIMLGGADEAWRKITRKDAGMGMLNRFLRRTIAG